MGQGLLTNAIGCLDDKERVEEIDGYTKDRRSE